jgi:hypothetical protein
MNHTISKVNHLGVDFKVANGTFYDSTTPDQVIEVLENARLGCVRLHIDLGDPETGKSWGEVNDVRGYVGRSTGERKVPLLLHNTRSMGGGAILTHCIVKITRSDNKNRVLYENPKYKSANLK